MDMRKADAQVHATAVAMQGKVCSMQAFPSLIVQQCLAPMPCSSPVCSMYVVAISACTQEEAIYLKIILHDQHSNSWALIGLACNKGG